MRDDSVWNSFKQRYGYEDDARYLAEKTLAFAVFNLRCRILDLFGLSI